MTSKESVSSDGNLTESPRPADVIHGRGFIIQDHPGNRRLRAIVDKHKYKYQHSRRDGKRKIASLILSLIKEQDGGRFLKLTPAKVWSEVTDHEALDKIGHTIRSRLCHDDHDGEVDNYSTKGSTASTNNKEEPEQTPAMVFLANNKSPSSTNATGVKRPTSNLGASLSLHQEDGKCRKSLIGQFNAASSQEEHIDLVPSLDNNQSACRMQLPASGPVGPQPTMARPGPMIPPTGPWGYFPMPGINQGELPCVKCSTNPSIPMHFMAAPSFPSRRSMMDIAVEEHMIRARLAELRKFEAIQWRSF